jgi:hypothetical protein
LKKIKFIPQSEWADSVNVELPMPTPASKDLPEWWSKAERWTGDEAKPKIREYSANHGVKKCVSFMDSLTSGYFLTTWTDIQFEMSPTDETESNLHWLTKPDPLVVRPLNQGTTLPRPAGHGQTPFAWVGQWGIQLPKGYSVLLTHPFNRFELPFTTMSGIIDSDECFASGNIPFFVKSGWEGILPAGTPIAQVLPFKRDDWESVKGTEEDKKMVLQQSFDARRILNGLYMKTQWSKKTYK